MKVTPHSVIPNEVVIAKIFQIRNQKVMLDSDLAELYQVETKRLNEQVRRNLNRFPPDFMFQLNPDEWENLKSQNATSSDRGWGGRRTLPYVFTEHGVLMLSSVLSSDRAVQVNIQIMRVYTRMREMMLTNQDLLIKVEQLESRMAGQEESVSQIFAYLKKLLHEEVEPRKRIGYKTRL